MSVVDRKLNLNPKRLITFERRNLNRLRAELVEALKRGETDYVVWLSNRISWSEKMVDKKVRKVVRYEK